MAPKQGLHRCLQLSKFLHLPNLLLQHKDILVNSLLTLRAIPLRHLPRLVMWCPRHRSQVMEVNHQFNLAMGRLCR